MLDKSRQLLSMNIINQEQLDNFVFNYGKYTKMNKAIREPASQIKEAVSQIREPASQMSKAMTTSIREPASQMTISTSKQDTIKTKQPLLVKEVFSPQITKFRRQRIIPSYKNETWQLI